LIASNTHFSLLPHVLMAYLFIAEGSEASGYVNSWVLILQTTQRKKYIF